MANRYANLVGSKKISEDFNNINIGFDRVQSEMDTNKGTADSHIANADIHVTASKKAEWDSKAPGNTATDLISHKANTVVHVTQADHDKLDGIEGGAQVNQNAFSKVNDIAAADPEDTVTIKGGVGITVTTNPTSKEVTVTATGSAAPGAHGTTHTEHGADQIPTATLTEGGLLSAAQLAEIVAHGELLDEHATAITGLESGLDNLAGVGRTIETVKGNAEAIANFTTQLAGKANKTSFDAHIAEPMVYTTVVSRDLTLTGNQVITGFGFKPKLVLINANVDAVKGKMSFGQITDAFQSVMRNISLDVDGAYQYVLGYGVSIYGGVGNAAGGVVYIQEDGIQIYWTKDGSGVTGTVNLFITAISHY